MTHFQPRLDPSQAALIYLIEPVVAALFAMGHRPLTGRVCGGAVLILLANLLVELLQARGRTESAASLADS
jgi:drug/metabolite transporter (DMT)-like permease